MSTKDWEIDEDILSHGNVGRKVVDSTSFDARNKYLCKEVKLTE